MSVIDEFLANNEAYAGKFTKGLLLTDELFLVSDLIDQQQVGQDERRYK